MAKYSFEFKKKVVISYLNVECSYEFLANKYRIAASSKLKVRVKAYKEFGDDGINRFRKNKSYYFNFKINVI